jgi:flagellar protein FliO/FliZ
MVIDILLYLLLITALGGAGFVGYLFLRQHLNGGTGSVFGAKPERRLDVVEQWNLDARRRLVLVRRDTVEHLIMIGGPVDVVIETGIVEHPVKRQNPAPPSVVEPVFARPSRTFGSAQAAPSVPSQVAAAVASKGE